MATVGAPLNAEPALAEDRAKYHLPPKSYADAVEEDVPAESASGTNGSNETSKPVDAANGELKASVLRIVDTGAPAKDEKENKKEEKGGDRPDYCRQESQQEYSANVC
jgi:2-acylglycerol O-acyltransferase 2